MIWLECRVLFIHLNGRIIFFVISIWISLIKFWTLKPTFVWCLHNWGWFCPSLIPLIFIGRITLFNFFLNNLGIKSRKLHHILRNHRWRRTEMIDLIIWISNVNIIKKSFTWCFKIIVRHLSSRIVHSIRETSL